MARERIRCSCGRQTRGGPCARCRAADAGPRSCPYCAAVLPAGANPLQVYCCREHASAARSDRSKARLSARLAARRETPGPLATCAACARPYHRQWRGRPTPRCAPCRNHRDRKTTKPGSAANAPGSTTVNP